MNEKQRGGWGAQVSEVFNITSLDEDDLQHAIAIIGPVSIVYQVSPDFRLYSHGVYDSYNVTTHETMCKSGNHNVNHAVVAVGLGTSIAKDVTITSCAIRGLPIRKWKVSPLFQVRPN